MPRRAAPARKTVTRTLWEDDPRPTLEHERRFTKRRYADFSEEVRVLARALHDAWRDECLLDMRFVSPRDLVWMDLTEPQKVLYCAQAEMARRFLDAWDTLGAAHRAVLCAEVDS